jgi:hypothetical protein
MVFFQKLGVHFETSLTQQLLKVEQHPFANSGNRENLFRFLNQLPDLLRQRFDGSRGIAIRTDAERILAVNLEQIGGFVQNAGDSLVIHWKRKLYRCCWKADSFGRRGTPPPRPEEVDDLGVRKTASQN